MIFLLKVHYDKEKQRVLQEYLIMINDTDGRGILSNSHFKFFVTKIDFKQENDQNNPFCFENFNI